MVGKFLATSTFALNLKIMHDAQIFELRMTKLGKHASEILGGIKVFKMFLI